MTIALKVLESIWHMAASSFNSSGFAAFDAPKVELCSITIPEIDALGRINNPALKPCLFHEHSRVNTKGMTLTISQIGGLSANNHIREVSARAVVTTMG